MSKKGKSLHELLKPLRGSIHLGEINQGREHGIAAKKTRSEEDLRRRSPYELDGVSASTRMALKSAPIEHRAAARLNLEGLTPEIMEQRREGCWELFADNRPAAIPVSFSQSGTNAGAARSPHQGLPTH